MARRYKRRVIDLYSVNYHGFHEFASPQIPEFYSCAPLDGLKDAIANMPETLSRAIETATGQHTKVYVESTFRCNETAHDDEIREVSVFHFSVQQKGGPRRS